MFHSICRFAPHSRLLLLPTLAVSMALAGSAVSADPLPAAPAPSASVLPVPLLPSPLPVASLPPTSTGKVVLPERTEVRVRLQEDLKSGANQSGEEVPFTVSADVYGPGHVLLIPAGTSAYGKVTKSSRRGIFGKAGKLAFTCEYVFTADGTHVPLRSDPLEQEGGSNSGTALALGLLISPLGLLMNGKDVTVHKGEEFNVYVNENTPLTPTFIASAPSAAPATPASGKSLFSLKGGELIAGSMMSFDGATYSVATDQGVRKIAAAEIKSIYSLK